MLRTRVLESIVFASTVALLGTAVEAANNGSYSPGTTKVAVPDSTPPAENYLPPDNVLQPDNVLLPDDSVQADGSEWLQPELLPPPEEVLGVEALPAVATPATEGVYVPTDPTGESLPKTDGDVTPPPTHRRLGDFWGYRMSQHSMSWTMGDGDQFGNFSLDPNPYLKSGATWGIHGGLGVKFLSGPQRTDMPPRVFDISLGVQHRKSVGDLAYDVSFAVLAATDFEGSVRDGILFPAHAVGYVTLTPEIDLVFGIDYLDRDDIHILPVGGVLLRPGPDVRIELVFPRPRVELQLAENYRLYFRGALGGGTWAVERDTLVDDLATLYELEMAVGVANKNGDGDWSATEFVYLFDRKLEYQSGIGDYDIGPTLMLRFVTLY